MAQVGLILGGKSGGDLPSGAPRRSKAAHIAHHPVSLSDESSVVSGNASYGNLSDDDAALVLLDEIETRSAAEVRGLQSALKESQSQVDSLSSALIAECERVSQLEASLKERESQVWIATRQQEAASVSP